MIPVNKLVEVFYTMLGWPYASPGTNGPAGGTMTPTCPMTTITSAWW